MRKAFRRGSTLWNGSGSDRHHPGLGMTAGQEPTASDVRRFSSARSAYKDARNNIAKHERSHLELTTGDRCARSAFAQFEHTTVFLGLGTPFPGREWIPTEAGPQPGTRASRSLSAEGGPGGPRRLTSPPVAAS